MNNVLNERTFVEQTRIVTDVNSIEGQTEGIAKLAELTKKGYKIVETFIQENEQNYLLEKGA